ncbi:SA1362 family protein [Bacillus sp. OK048]|uniref:SA1362 family protein n=1 Tax=Bacillus sp. OK048 TaxID=1882761 RepID=UPI002676FD77|nr:SA1362 family protein [Bacillus sp. OK048]
MAFLKNRISVPLVGSVIVLGIIGIIGAFTSNPIGFLQSIAVFALVGLAIFYVFRLIAKANPQKKEQQAFIKAAKKSKKRLQSKTGEQQTKSSSLGSLASLKKSNKIKKKSPVHLTVIDGKKGKKKNRASL